MDGKRIPPNNWKSYFSGSAWKWDEETQEYYLHLFAVEQPDLNWENADARRAIRKSAMEFWLSKGVDGFRIDTVNMYSKDMSFPDAPITDPGVFEQPAHMLFCNGPRMHEFLRELNSEVLSKYNTMTVGELPHTPDPAQVLTYVGSEDKQMDMVFQFDIVDLGQGTPNKYDQLVPWKLPELKAIVARWQQFTAGTDGWTTAFLENHDQGRSVSRYGSDDPKWRVLSAKMLAMMMCVMTGTLFIYQGQETGMINAPKDWPIEDYKDIESVNYYETIKKMNDPKRLAETIESIQLVGREHARLPMQWDDTAFAGFTTKETGAWMRTHDNYTDINVQSQADNPDSVLGFWKQMLKIRKENKDLFIHGEFVLWDAKNEETFVFGKTEDQGKVVIVVALNFTGGEQPFKHPISGLYKCVISNVGYANVDQRYSSGKYLLLLVVRGLWLILSGDEGMKLRPYEGRIYTVQA